MTNYKILPYQKIQSMVEYGLIKNSSINNIQPASLDITLKLKQPLIVEKDFTAVVPINESFFELRNDYKIKLTYSSRSTTARNGISVKAIEKYKGDYVLEITPLYKDIILQNNDKLGQFYFHDLNQKVENQHIEVGTIEIGNTNTFLKPNEFYLLKSIANNLTIPNDTVGILREYEPKLGHYFTHLNAGFFDPGFSGYPVFEVISAQTINIECNKPFAYIDYIPLTEPTLKPYNGNYQNQKTDQDIQPKIDYTLANYLRNKL